MSALYMAVHLGLHPHVTFIFELWLTQLGSGSERLILPQMGLHSLKLDSSPRVALYFSMNYLEVGYAQTPQWCHWLTKDMNQIIPLFVCQTR